MRISDGSHSDMYFDQHGHLTDGGVSLYVDALKLSREDQLPNRIVEHVETCNECKRSIVHLATALREYSYDHLHPHPRLVEKKISPNKLHIYFRVAAVLVLVVGLAYLLAFLFSSDNEIITIIEPKREQDKGVVQDIPEVEDPAGDPVRPLFADNFEPSVVYESLVNIQYRSYGIRMHSPRIEEEVEDTVVFSWDIQFTDPLYLTILNNREEIVHTVELETHSYNFPIDTDPGLYYWKLESEDDLLYTGKFIVPVGG